MKLADFPFQPKCTDEHIKIGKDWLAGLEAPTRTRDSLGTCHFAIVDTAGTLKAYMSQGCHASMQSSIRDFGSREVIATTNLVTQRTTKDKNLCRPFFDWLMDESFVSRFIMNRDDREFCWNHGFVLSSDVPSALLQNCLIVTRHFRECTDKEFEYFNKLLPIVGGNMAFMLAMNTAVASGSGFLLSVATHRAYGMMGNVKALENFINDDFGEALTDDPALFYRNKQTIYGGHTYCDNPTKAIGWGGPLTQGTYTEDLCKNDNEFMEALKLHRKGGAGFTGVINPFEVRTNPYSSSPYVLSRKETDEVLVPYLVKLFGLKGASVNKEQELFCV